VLGLVLGVVGVVLAVRARLPHVENGVRDALACVCVADDAVEERELAVRGHVLHDAAAEVAEGGVGGPEGAQDGGGGGREVLFGDNGVVDFVDETTDMLAIARFTTKMAMLPKVGFEGYSRLNTQHIANPPRLIPVLLVSLADRVDIIDADNPLVLRELDLSAEIVQMLDQRG